MQQDPLYLSHFGDRKQVSKLMFTLQCPHFLSRPFERDTEMEAWFRSENVLPKALCLPVATSVSIRLAAESSVIDLALKKGWLAKRAQATELRSCYCFNAFSK